MQSTKSQMNGFTAMNLQSKIYMDILFKSKKNLYLKSVDIIFPVVTTGSLDFSNFEKD